MEFEWHELTLTWCRLCVAKLAQSFGQGGQTETLREFRD